MDACRDTLANPGAHYHSGYCMGFFHAAIQAIKKDPANCIKIPPGASLDQVMRVTVKYLDDHPERRHLTPLEHVVPALTDAFPCPDKP